MIRQNDKKIEDAKPAFIYYKKRQHRVPQHYTIESTQSPANCLMLNRNYERSIWKVEHKRDNEQAIHKNEK